MPDDNPDFLNANLTAMTWPGRLLVLATLLVWIGAVALGVALLNWLAPALVSDQKNKRLAAMLGLLPSVLVAGGFYLLGQRILGKFGIPVFRRRK